MKGKRYVVRVVIPAIDPSPPLAQRVDDKFIEALRYAGLIQLHHNDAERQTFDIRAPVGIDDTKDWSERNADRMKSFGYNAVSAPAWGDEEPGK